MNKNWKEKAALWAEKNLTDGLSDELGKLSEEEKEEAFYTDLEFGTAGLRGVLGVGTNRMNVYTVGQAAEALARFVEKEFPSDRQKIAISYDSRHKSELFARMSAAIFAMHNITAYIYPTLMPTPCLSYAVRALHCAAGVMVTASHNPSRYNGYKVYGEDGSQMTSVHADQVYAIIQTLDIFKDTKQGDFDSLLKEGKIQWIGEDIISSYIEEVKKQSCLGPSDHINKDVAIVYTPLYGAGLKPVTRVLNECGYTNIRIVEEQKNPNGDFPTCPYPNPEIPETMALGIEYCKKYGADLLIATDPDSDRCAIAVKDKEGNYPILSGNEVGVLIADYVLMMRKKNNTLPKNPVLVKSVVTTDLVAPIAASYGAELRNVLTGFKYIGEQIFLLEKDGEGDRYVLGFEESCGYLTGTYARDKDAVNAALIVAEMFCYYKTEGISLLDRLNKIGDQYGHYCNRVHSFEYDGIAGKEKMKEIAASFRSLKDNLVGYPIEKVLDYKEGIDGLPKSDVLKLFLKGGSSVVVRPSGTEPKMKLYITTTGKTRDEAEKLEEKLLRDLTPLMQ